MRTAGVIVAALCLTAHAPARADEIIAQIDQAKRYYDEGDYAGAIVEFEFTISTLRTKLAELFAATLPDPLPRWRAEAAEIEAGATMFGGGTTVYRNYNNGAGDGVLRAQLIVDSPVVQAVTAMLSSPAVMAGQGDLERIRIGHDSAMLDWDQGARRGEISLALGQRVMAKIEGYDLDDKMLLVELLKAWDIEAVRSVAGR
jgi:hypothetical protein